MTTIEDLKARRSKLITQRDAVFASAGVPDRAAAHASNIARQQGPRTDAALERYADLTRRITQMHIQIARMEAPPRDRTASMPEVHVGDQIQLISGTLATVVRVNAKSVTTTSGSRWAASEIHGVIPKGEL